MKTYNLNILGSRWKMKILSRIDDPMFESVDGYTDRSTKTIYIPDDSFGEIDDLKNYDAYLKEVKRHEIIHAFLYESGLAQNMYHSTYGHDECEIDWFAMQFPKMLKVFEKAEAI